MSFPMINIYNNIIEADMPHMNYILIKDDDNEYKCFMKIYIDTHLGEHEENLRQYLKCANYQYVQFIPMEHKIEVLFTVNLSLNISDIIEVQEIITDLYDDFIFVLKLLSDEKKILRHYPSLITHDIIHN